MSTARKIIALLATLAVATNAQYSAVDVATDVYHTCLKHLSVSCVKPKALAWISNVSENPLINISDDLVLIKKENEEVKEEKRSSAHRDIFDTFEDFLQTHDLVAKVPSILRSDGPLGKLVPRSFQPEDLSVPLASTGRSKVVKKVIVPFLLGLKFKSAVLVPLALALIALKTWKALTLGLLSLVLTAAMVIFKFTKPKVVNYEVIHYPHHVDSHHYDHHVDHHVDHPPPVTSGWEAPTYGREFSAQDLAYNGYLSE